MNYKNGKAIMVGDLVSLGGEMKGIVICSLDDQQALHGVDIEKWLYLKKGIVISSKEAGLVYYDEPDYDLRLIRRL